MPKTKSQTGGEQEQQQAELQTVQALFDKQRHGGRRSLCADKQTAAASLRHRRHDQRVIISCDIE